MAREMGWTLEYIDSISAADLHEYWQIVDGENRAHNDMMQSRRK